MSSISAHGCYGDDPAGIILGRRDFKECGGGEGVLTRAVRIALVKTFFLLKVRDVVLTPLMALPLSVVESRHWALQRFTEIKPLDYAVLRAACWVEDELGQEIALTSDAIRVGIIDALCALGSDRKPAMGMLLDTRSTSADPVVEAVDTLLERLEDEGFVVRDFSNWRWARDVKTYVMTEREFWPY